MQLQIRGKGTELTDQVRAHIERRLRFALSRFGERVARATVRIAGVADSPGCNGDPNCRIEVALRPTGIVIVDETRGDVLTAIERAAERAGRSVSREIERSLESNAARPHRSKP